MGRGVVLFAEFGATPWELRCRPGCLPRVARGLATLGWRAESLRDSSPPPATSSGYFQAIGTMTESLRDSSSAAALAKRAFRLAAAAASSRYCSLAAQSYEKDSP